MTYFILKQSSSQSLLRNKKGMVTIPFLLVSMILLVLILFFLFLNMTLTHVSITQYMSYSTARNLSLAFESSGTQANNAKSHYIELRDKFFGQGTYTEKSGAWFEITDTIEKENIGAQYGSYPELNPDASNRKRFYGVSLKFKSNALKLKIPFLSQGQDTPLGGRVSSFLAREPSTAECRVFMEKKYEVLGKKCNATECPGIEAVDTSSWKPDNGC